MINDAGSVETAKLRCRFPLVQGKLCSFLINLSLLKVDSQRYLQASILRINLAHFIVFGNCFSLTNIQKFIVVLSFCLFLKQDYVQGCESLLFFMKGISLIVN